MKKIIIIIVCFSVTIFNVYSQQTHFKLDSLAKDFVLNEKSPSMTIAYITPDTVYYGMFGTNRNNNGAKVKILDKYHLGSNTKAFTSLLAFKLIEEGIISLETKLLDILPDLDLKSKECYKDINLSELLSHTAMVKPFTNGKEYKKLPELTGNTTEKRLSFAKYVLKQKPSKKGTYSNAGYILAALMLETVSEKSYETLLSETLNELELDFHFGFPNTENAEYPWGHWVEKRKLIGLSSTHEYRLEDFALPAGDLSMNIVDYSKFIQLHLFGILGENNFLKANSYQKIFYDKEPYSYGWSNQINDKGKLVFHDGSAGTFYAHTIISSTSEFAVVFLINSAEENHIEGLYSVRNKIFKIRKEIR